MTQSHFSAVDSSDTHRFSLSTVAGTDHLKRKFDDYVASSSPDSGVDLLLKMKKHEVDFDHMATSQQSSIPWRFRDNSCQNQFFSSSAECSSAPESSAPESSNRPESTRLQIFVRMMSGGKTIVIHADMNDTVEMLHQIIEFKTKIPVIEQRFIYKGKQLQYEKTLSYYSMEQDESLHLVGRMQSTEHPVAWQTVDDIMYFVSRMYKGEIINGSIAYINEKLTAFFSMIPTEKDDSISKYLEIFSSSSVPTALVMLYVSSSLETNKSCAKSSIKLFLSSCITLPKIQQNYCLPIVLEFCRLLRKACPDNKLYVSCRSTLGKLLESSDTSGGFHGRRLDLGEIFPYFTELGELVMQDLLKNSGPSSCDVLIFSSFLHPLRKAVELQIACSVPIALALRNTLSEPEIGHLLGLFRGLLSAMNVCMGGIETSLGNNGIANSEVVSASWSQYLNVLKIINSISNLYPGAKQEVADLLNLHKVAFCTLVLKFVKREDDHQWIYEFKEATVFESRRHLAMLLFPDVREDFEEMHEMLIDRSNLLPESFEYIAGASAEALHGGLFMEFKNEEATGPGVLREWFYSVCQEIFNSQNTLFLRSVDDFRRFSPNSASKVDPLHPDFYKFTGRVIALALMHKVHVGVLFDRVFFLQLAGQRITLEDIKDTDRIMYNSCKQILEMDPVSFDANAGLGLTFVLETEELGKRETIELCKDGRSMTVNSKNREKYVDLLIEHRFATTISSQVSRFCQGFSDILSDFVPSSSFFKRINLEDLDGMLGGGENPINIEDWQAHTEYNGFKDTDRQIEWFWKILKKMTEEEQRSILFFWTSCKYVPVEGFRGLASKLYIYRLYEANDRLPVAHTCFYRLCIPKYPTMSLMEQRLRFIVQDHVYYSFGKW